MRERAPALEAGWTPAYEDASAWLAARARPGDMIVTMGAGPVDRVIGLVRERLA
jgi:UDP-N-acetylmuramate-alanine ligase